MANYDPSLIKFQSRSIALYDILKRIESGGINTAFQPKEIIWDDVRQSRLIESILLRVPIPSFYFDQEDGDMWQVVDGRQRITAIKNFVIDKKLKLVGLEYFSDLEGKGFSDLPPPLRRQINAFQIVACILQKETPLEIKQNIFKRIKSQEIRK